MIVWKDVRMFWFRYMIALENYCVSLVGSPE